MTPSKLTKIKTGATDRYSKMFRVEVHQLHFIIRNLLAIYKMQLSVERNHKTDGKSELELLFIAGEPYK